MKKLLENPKTYFCEICNYNTSSCKDYNKHLLTAKHLNRTNLEQKIPKIPQILSCKFCNKYYKARNSLWYHEQKCGLNPTGKTNSDYNNDNKNLNNKTETNTSILDKDELIITLLKQNAELLEIVKNGTHNTTTNNTNSHNKAFNLNFFLNETCKNAMNITDFVDSIKLQLSDFMEVGKMGYVEGLSNIIVKKLNDLDETVRPIHCTDQKRETFYVKDENKWEKEEEDFNRIRKMIKKIAIKNENLMSAYKAKFPDYNEYNSKRSDQYSKYVIEAMGGEGDNTKEKENKIIKHISRATTIKQKASNELLNTN